MTTFLLIFLLVVAVPALAALFHAIHRAADGYEDDVQFNAGVHPGSGAASAPAGQAAAPNWVEGPRTQRIPAQQPNGESSLADTWTVWSG